MMKKVLFLLAVTASLFGGNRGDEIKMLYFKSYDYEQMQKYTEAIKVLTPLYGQYPDGYTLNLRFGWLFYLSGQYNDAIKYYKKASFVNSKSLESKLGLIRIYLATNSYQKAHIAATGILKVDYYNYYANLYMIKALIAQKKYDAATNTIRKMLSLYPTDILFLEQLLIVYKHTGSKYFKKLYEDILILDPNNVLVKNLAK